MIIFPEITSSMTRNVYSAGNYQLMDEESTEGMVILLGITSSWTRNPQEEWLFCWELTAHRREIHRRNSDSAGNYQLKDEESNGEMVILLGITSSWTKNPPEKWLFCWELPAHGRRIHRRNGYSTGNYQLMDEESTGRMVILLGITSSWTRNPPEKFLFCWESPAHGRGIHRRNGYSAGNYQLIDEKSTGGMVILPGSKLEV
jgi:hypothetical protein